MGKGPRAIGRNRTTFLSGCLFYETVRARTRGLHTLSRERYLPVPETPLKPQCVFGTR